MCNQHIQIPQKQWMKEQRCPLPLYIGSRKWENTRGALSEPVSDVPRPLRSRAVWVGVWLRRRALLPEASWAPLPRRSWLWAQDPRAAPHPTLPQDHTPASSVCPREAPAIRVSVSLRIEVVDVTGIHGVSVVSTDCHYVQTEDVTTCICSHRTRLRPKV